MVLGLLVGGLLLSAMCVRSAASYGATVVFGYFVPLLLVTALAALGMLGALAGSLWWRDRRDRRTLAADPHRFTGTVTTSDSDPRIGGVEITSWLRGPQLVLAPCTVTTSAGELVVPGGAELVAHVPLDSTLHRTGEVAVVMQAGDEVTVTGFAPPPDGHPFRDSAALVPGRVRIGLRDDPGSITRDIALAMWRPCVAYLVILAAIAVPALL
jgi:hypothetical protein